MITTETENMNPAISHPPSPAPLFEALNRYQHTMVLKGAIELEIFTHIAGGAKSPAEIAVLCNASERGVRILCDFLTVQGFLTKSKSQYELTQESAAFLAKQSPAYMGTIADFIAGKDALAGFRDVAAMVRKGGALEGSSTIVPENNLWVQFARTMAPIATMTARLMAPIVSEPGKRIKVLDIAAGHGMYGITIAQRNASATVVALDWANVLEVAIGNASKARVSDRYSTIPGDVFDVDLGGGYDLVLLPNILHHFDAPENVRLLKKIRAAMNPGSSVATLEFVPNDDRVSPPIPAAFSMMMLARTERGDAYTFKELNSMFRDAGFVQSRAQALPPSPQTLILTEY